MFVKAEGIVINSKDYGEGNKILTVYTKEVGKVSMMARGAKKTKSRLSSISQLFTYGLYMFSKGSGMGTLSQGEILESFRDLRQDLIKTSYAAYFAELLNKLTEDGERNPYIFELFLEMYRYLDEGKDPEILARLFELKMLMASGFSPQLSQCVSCGTTKGTFSFSSKEGGFLCDQCHWVDSERIPIYLSLIHI